MTLERTLCRWYTTYRHLPNHRHFHPVNQRRYFRIRLAETTHATFGSGTRIEVDHLFSACAEPQLPEFGLDMKGGLEASRGASTH